MTDDERIMTPDQERQLLRILTRAATTWGVGGMLVALFGIVAVFSWWWLAALIPWAACEIAASRQAWRVRRLPDAPGGRRG